MRFDVQVEGFKIIEGVEAKSREEAEQIVSEMPLKIEDFDWSFDAEEGEFTYE